VKTKKTVGVVVVGVSGLRMMKVIKKEEWWQVKTPKKKGSFLGV
jgi:hypothetical protein